MREKLRKSRVVFNRSRIDRTGPGNGLRTGLRHASVVVQLRIRYQIRSDRKILYLRKVIKLITVCDHFPGIFAEQFMRFGAVRIVGNELSSPAKRVNDAVVIQHRKIPFPFVHITLEHKLLMVEKSVTLINLRRLV